MLTDTSAEAAIIHTALLRQSSATKRLRLMRSLSYTTLHLSRQTMRRLYPRQWPVCFIEQVYDSTIAREFFRKFTEPESDRITQEAEMDSPDIFAALLPVIETLRQMNIACHIGGSFASSAHGIPRATADVDLVADLRSSHAADFVARLQQAYYVDEVSIHRAIEHRSSFNLIHLATMLKVDVFIPKGRAFDREAARRAVTHWLDETKASAVCLASPEDTILTKLEWYRKGGEVSQKQLADVIGVLRIQAETIDKNYLQHWAQELAVSDLLERALAEAEKQTSFPNAGKAE